jgi:hypothetical protein
MAMRANAPQAGSSDGGNVARAHAGAFDHA